jgi:hypothetical protein
MFQFPGKTAWGFVFDPSSSTSSTLTSAVQNFCSPNNTLNSPRFGHSTQMLASSLAGLTNSGFKAALQARASWSPLTVWLQTENYQKSIIYLTRSSNAPKEVSGPAIDG